jgi:hypothetical protein
LVVISSAELVQNGALFGRAAAESFLLEDVGEGDWRFVAVFAATSLEQVTKAALAFRNVLLLAENNDQSLLWLAGATVKRRPRTISALAAVSRYSSFNHRFGSLSEALGTLIDYRNGVVHLAADQPEDFVGLFDEYLRAVELVLEDLGQDEELFWGGPELLAVVQGRRSRRARTIEEDVARQVATAAARLQARYQHLSPDERQAAMLAAAAPRATFYEDYVFLVECLACGSDGWLGVGIDVDWDLDDGEMVPHAYTSPALFQCTVCGLALVGDEIEAGLGDIELPDDFQPSDFSEPPSYDDIPGLSMEDVHPYPRP